LIFVAFLMTVAATAQQNNIQSAIRSLNYEPMKYSDLENAKDAIDKAAENELTANDPKMWFIRGKVYDRIANNKEAKEKNLDPQAAEKAVVSFVNAIKTDTKKNYYDDCKSMVTQASITLFSKAVNAYSSGDPAGALKMYKLLYAVFPLDVDNVLKRSNITPEILYKNSYFAANKAGDKSEARANLQKLIDIKFNDPKIYFWMSDLELEQKDTAKAIAVIEQGLSIFEDDGKLINRQIGLYLMTGKTDVLIGKLAESIEAAPDNEILYLIRGELYEAKNETVKAEADYLQVLQLNPDHFVANYDLGTLHFNRAVEFVKKAQEADQKNNLNESMKWEKEYKAEFQKSETYLTKAKEINPKKTEDDNQKYRITLQSLRQIYARTNRLDKANEMKAELEK
jgi:tetratricopeptide (TPR) repeat protein